jgi:hypothetical protein
LGHLIYLQIAFWQDYSCCVRSLDREYCSLVVSDTIVFGQYNPSLFSCLIQPNLVVRSFREMVIVMRPVRLLLA